MIIIFGASGFLGRYLYTYFRNHYPHEYMLGTYHQHPMESLIQYDFTQSNLEEISQINKIRYAIICSGQTGIDTIKKEPDHYRDLNVIQSIKLIQKINDIGITPVYISTDNVFDGTKGNYREDNDLNPINLYGSQKKEVEEFISKYLNQFIIIRLNKLYSSDPHAKNWLVNWIRALSQQTDIACDTTQQFCPTHVMDVAQGIDKLISTNKQGIYHMASHLPLTYMEIGQTICNYYGYSRNQLKEVQINHLGLLEKRPLKINLNSEKLLNETGFKCREISETIQLMKTFEPVK